MTRDSGRRLQRRGGERSRRTRPCVIEMLETRRLLSTINWVNRGLASDRFGEVFGASANVARAVVDEAIARWQRVITDFNYSNGTNTYSLTVAMSATSIGNGGVGGSTANI